MKTYHKKIIFGLVLTLALSGSNYILATQENVGEIWFIILVVFAMKIGIVLWIILLIREHKRLQIEKFKRKNK